MWGQDVTVSKYTKLGPQQSHVLHCAGHIGCNIMDLLLRSRILHSNTALNSLNYWLSSQTLARMSRQYHEIQFVRVPSFPTRIGPYKPVLHMQLIYLPLMLKCL